MKKAWGLRVHYDLLLAALMVLVALPAFAQVTQVGEKLSDLRLTDVSGRNHSLADYAASGKVVVLQFWSFKCPVSLAYDDRLAALQEKYGSRGVVVLAVASNTNETGEDIQRNASNLNLRFPILLDRDGMLAEKLGATHTPSVFILDQHLVLRYRGALDNNKRVGDSGRVAYAEDALDAILAGRSIPQPETKAFGCSIKRKP